MADWSELIPFQFKVSLLDPDAERDTGILCQGAFSEVTGLEAQTTVKAYAEGGRNWGVVQLAGPTTFPAVVLKRGVTSNGDLWQWFDLTHRQARYHRRLSAEIDVVDPANHERVRMRFSLTDVMLSKFAGPQLSATSNAVAVEEVQLVHQGLTLSRPDPEQGAENAQ